MAGESNTLANTGDKVAAPPQNQHHMPIPGMDYNPDPALNPANQHTHAHHHHSARIDAAGGHDDAVYTSGTTMDPSLVPAQQHGDNHHAHGVDKKDPLNLPEYSDNEKAEAGVLSTGRGSGSTDHRHGESGGGFMSFYRRYRPVFHLIYFLLFTGWWIASLILHRDDKNWVVPFLLWLAISLRLFFYYVPSRYLSTAIHWVWSHTALVVYELIPPAFRIPLGAFGALAVIIVGSFASEEVADNNRANRAVSLFGLVVMLFVFWATSAHRSRINWRTVIVGMLAQYIIGLFVLRTGVGYDIFKFIADRAGDLLGFARQGVAFLTSPETSQIPWFFFGVIPAIIFFISLVQVLYYIGFLQWFIKKFATFVFWALGVSGAEAVVAAATPFIGQGESAMLVRPFVPHMTKAELHQIMTCGFATISGSVLVGYIQLGLNAEALVSSCIMSIPASLAISKLRYPETEETLTAGRVVIPDDDEHKAENALHAFANGAWLGIKIGGTIIASLLCIIAFVGLINALMTWWGRYLNINDPTLTLQTILGYMLYPVAFLLGVPRDNNDILLVARLIAQKVITNEYNGFHDLTTDKTFAGLSPRSRLIATYALCGFGNIGSLGIQIGILGQLAPSRGGDVSRLAVSALISGVVATLTSATVAGLVVTTQITNFSSAPQA
ncbi:inner membrane transport protein yeiJ [Metarhizium acridum CQMa 102]|uniref:Inner membrane transport protein yeiJ n=1 Tax=Metarhizium acridum (strain CQMa 102) TaxID=655827 RepID=E9EBV0_METAQ|nr:inner membrane transport protein yeiJ [Metarhizium acridum CQMa 102]EFY86570.1 inner membrane transport protein yeiJ [Metarhizium acridum CQMa 102]